MANFRKLAAYLAVACSVIFLTYNFQDNSTGEIRAVLDLFYENYLGRKLSSQELDRVTREQMTYFGGDTCDQSCADQLTKAKQHANTMRTSAGQPVDLAIRHAILSTTFFSPLFQGTHTLELLAEPDPIRVIDSKHQRLMTEKDVVALKNLGYFIQHPDTPKHRALSRQEVDETTALLQRTLRDVPNAEISIMAVYAAELWTGTQREWPDLTAEERKIIMEYVKNNMAKGTSAPLPQALYSRLFGLNGEEARLVYQLDERRESMTQFQTRWKKNYAAFLGNLQKYSLLQSLR